MYTYPCPNVSPNSAIYFYQMTLAGADPTWTTRFTIADAKGETTKPKHATQAGENIPWGTGKLSGAQPSAVASVVSSAMVESATSAATTDDAPTATATTDAATETSASAISSSESHRHCFNEGRS